METLKESKNDSVTGNDADSLANTPVKYLTATTIVGIKVCNHLGEQLGKIKDIMVDINEGKVEYIVIEFGGFLGIGEKYFAVPLKALQIDAEHQRFFLNRTRDMLQNAPGFDNDHWPETNSHTMKATSEYWGNKGIRE